MSTYFYTAAYNSRRRLTFGLRNLWWDMKKQKLKKPTRKNQPEVSWRRAVVRKWLNIAANSDYSADSDTGSGSDSEWEQEACDWPKQSRFKYDKPDESVTGNGAVPRTRRRNSETFRAQYINQNEIKICAATWNVGGQAPPDDLDLDGWLDVDDPADVYVIGLQEMIPLNASNIFGAEDIRRVAKWENIIRETLNQVPPVTKFKSYSDPPSPSRFKPPDDIPIIEEEVILESGSDVEDEIIYPVNEEPNGLYEINNRILDGRILDSDNFDHLWEHDLEQELSSPRSLERLNGCLRTDDSEETVEASNLQYTEKLTRSLSGRERFGLSWPEPPLHLLPQPVLEKPNSFGSNKSFKTNKSFRTYNSFKSNSINENTLKSGIASLLEVDLESLIHRKRRPTYVRILSKQMVGIFITIWVRRRLRRHIQNVSVSSVGVGIMGYIGNKGSISVSMSIHQTLFCFICSHLTSGEKEADAVKRNDDVLEIHRRTRFNSHSTMGLPKKIFDHERIIWLGDLNYRINLSYEWTRELISRRDWSKLAEQDQLSKELKKGRVFDGWSEGCLRFAPTYKYEFNSESYIGDDPKAGRRTPSWCDRILSFGTGMKLLDYRRSEAKFSDHRPVTATYMVEVEVFSPKKLQRALTFTDAEVQEHEIITDADITNVMVRRDVSGPWKYINTVLSLRTLSSGN